jgi:type IV secretory pathway VirB6-like protein
MKKIQLFLVMLMFFLSSCDDAKIPIEADDFGYPKIIVQAKGLNITGTEDNELSEWLPTAYKYNGEPLAIMVYNDSGDYSALWTGWFGANEDTISSLMRSSSMCDIATPTLGDDSVTFNDPNQPPCIFHKGQGLYLLLTNPAVDITDPNLYPTINRNPSSATVNFMTLGLWQDIAMYSQGSLAGGYLGDFDNSANYIGGAAYFKILDKYYDDNSGGFYAALKRGFDPKETPPITYVIQMITSKIDETSKELYISITENGQYLLALKIGLTLYMMIQGLLYTMGMLNMNQKELLFSFIKLIIVMQLLTSDASWALFNNYFFTFFTDGLDEVLGIITSTVTGQSTSGFTFFDKMIGLFYSYETWMKILALCVSVPSGIVVTGLLALALGILTLAIVQGVVLYLLAYLAISILIVLAPIFITFMLFKITKPLFEGWINQFAGYFFQAVLVFASITLLGQIIIDKIYKILGFRVCYQDYISFDSNGVNFTLMKAWQICSFNMSELKDIIAIPGYGFWDLANPKRFCTPYECTGERYINLPFLDLVEDASLIKAFENPWVDLNLPMLYNGFILVLIAYLMFKFNSVVPDIGKGIASGGSGSSSQNALAGASQSSLGDIKRFAQGVNNTETVKLLKAGVKAGLTAGAGLGARTLLSPEKINAIKNYRKDRKEARKESQKKLDKFSEYYDKGVENIKGSKAFKLLSSIAKVAIPPLSMEMHTKEDEQKAAWREKKQKDAEEGNYSGFTKAKNALVNAASDSMARGISNTGGAIKRKTTNVARRAVGLEVQSKPVVTDDNILGVSDVIRASGRHAFNQVAESTKLAAHQIQAPVRAAKSIHRKTTNLSRNAKNLFRSKDNQQELLKKPKGYEGNDTDINQQFNYAGREAATRRQIEADQQTHLPRTQETTGIYGMIDRALDTRSSVEQENLNRENLAIVRALNYSDQEKISKEDQKKLDDPTEVNKMIDQIPEDKLNRMRDIMGNIRRGKN